jgi:hypothetical protein
MGFWAGVAANLSKTQLMAVTWGFVILTAATKLLTWRMDKRLSNPNVGSNDMRPGVIEFG